MNVISDTEEKEKGVTFLNSCHQPAVAPIFGEDADGFVKTGRHKLLSCRRIVHIQHCRDVVHVHCERPFQAPHVVCVQTDKYKKKLISKAIMGLNETLISRVL